MTWITRRGTVPRFRYRHEDGRPVSPHDAERIKKLVIPPAWRDVHIATTPGAAIQAWGYDARDRKQYIYHPNAVERGQIRKYYRVRQMARDLPEIRRRVARDFRKRGFPKEKVLATIVRLVALGFFRVGNEQYLRENKTFGISTFNKSHVTIDGECLIFSYIGKRSIKHRQVVVAADLARFIRTLLETPGRRLFRYQQDGVWYNITARDVNAYFHQLANGFPYTIKDLRTWGGTLRAAIILAEFGAASSMTEAKRNVATAMRLVAAELGNTPAICRSSYVHPVIVKQYVERGEVIQWTRRNGVSPYSHTAEERALIRFLDQYFPERALKSRLKGA